MNKIAFITGASAGIGEATAKLLAENGYNLILAARRKEKLEQLKSEIEKNTDAKVYCLNFDIQKRKDIEKAIKNLPEKWQQINILINNAGLGLGFDPVFAAEIEDWETMMDTNVKGLMSITHSLLPHLMNTQDAHIVNIGSTASKQVKKGSSVYSATKFAVEAFTKGLRIDLLKYDIRVTQINPGIVETEFALVKSKGNKTEADSAYKDYTPLKPIDVAEAILFAIERPKHVNINDILLTSVVEADMNNMINKIVE
ncbi:MAG: SDR family NAD(P)-dependent oxidoreductase [Bacteroidales bacterium]|nr:SDR family NAD(P)-dependent oxidoreductase [Bacteroidales bacterium]